MNYDEAMAFLEDTKKYGSILGLDSIRRLMAQLGNVQEKVPVIHIGGTNGKGSVGAMLSAVLTQAGYKTGRFNTPDVFCYEDEFLMNGIAIEKNRLAQLFSKVTDACKNVTAAGYPHPTRFEVETAAAYLWFYEEQVDVALVEVGMGGETDATNLITQPLVSVLTSISLDHIRFLGGTIREIAGVKSGIIKERCPVVTLLQKPEAMEVIRDKCEQVHAPLTIAYTQEALNPEVAANHIAFDWQFRQNRNIYGEDDTPMTRVCCSLAGEYQLENAVCALKTLERIRGYYPAVTTEAILAGMAQVRWPGRFEKVASSPDFYLDGAHNEDAVIKLHHTLKQCFDGRKIIYIMGVLADKNYDSMIRTMFSKGDRVYTVTPPNPRALEAGELAAILQEQNVDAVACENVGDAVSYAITDAKQDDVIVAFGSLYYLGKVRNCVPRE